MADLFDPREPTMPASSSRPVGRYQGLSERESEVLHLCAQGLTNREIADALFLNIETVRSHLKRAYQRLGLRNRAEAAAFVHQFGSPGAGQTSAGWARLIDRSPPTRVIDLDDIDREAMTERLQLLGLDSEARRRLAAYTDAASDDRTGFARREVRRWQSTPETARLLANHETADRMVQLLRDYVADVFNASWTLDHSAKMLQAGATHHRIHLLPQWYLASLAHVICDHLPLILGRTSGTSGDASGGAPHDASVATTGHTPAADAVESVVALVWIVLFDASVVLDGYEIALEHDLGRPSTAGREHPASGSVGEAGETGSGPPATVSAPHDPSQLPQPVSAGQPLTQMALDPAEAPSRREFIGLGPAQFDQLRALSPVVREVIPAVLEAFYTELSGHPTLAPLVPPPVVARLHDIVGQFWADLTVSSFDEAHAASRLRVGLIHERAGLTPQLYLIGLGFQLAGLVRAIATRVPDPLAAIDALIRAVLFDVTFILDAYLQARASALLQVHRFAGQLITGLANGVVVVDEHDQIEYANEELLAMVQVAPGLLHRLPLSDVMPLAELDELADGARSDPSGRATAVYEHEGRRYRVTAMRIDHAETGRDGLVALVVDDVSDLERLSHRIQHERRRLDHVLTSIDALVWEVNRDDFTVVVASSGAAVVLGVRAVDLVGRSLLTEHIHPADRVDFTSACRRLQTGQRVQIDHRLRRHAGEVWARTSLVATVDPNGVETICGVTMLAAGEPTAALAPHERLGDVLLDHTRASALELNDADPQDRIEHESFVIEAVEPGLLRILGLREPLAVPIQATDLAQVGWLLRGDLLRRNGQWHLVTIDSIEP